MAAITLTIAHTAMISTVELPSSLSEAIRNSMKLICTHTYKHPGLNPE